MIVKIEEKDIYKEYENIIEVNYNEMKWLLLEEKPLYFSIKRNCLSSMYYIIDNILIKVNSTQKQSDNYNIIKKYEEKAMKIYIGSENENKTLKLHKLFKDLFTELSSCNVKITDWGVK